MKPHPSEIDERNRANYDIPLDEGLALYRAAAENAMSRLYDQDKLTPTEARPMLDKATYFDGRLPPDWSGLSAREVGHLFELMCQHADFLGTKVTMAKVLKINAEERLALVKAAVRKSKRGTNEEKLDGTVVDSRYVQANAEYLEVAEYYMLLDNMLEAAGRDIKLLSRQIELRKLEMEGGRSPGNHRDRFR